MTQTLLSKDIEIILKNGEFYIVNHEVKSILSAAYPNINIDAELRKYAAWAYTAPSKRKTKRGILKSIRYWMSAAKSEPIVNSTRKRSVNDGLNDRGWAL